MMDLEDQLKSALRRKAPSSDFAAKVLDRVNRGPRPEARGLIHWRAIAAALMFTAVLGGWAAHTIAERRAGERAKEEVLTALRITSAKVHYARNQVHEIGRESR